MRLVVLLQARMGSERLPGKVMLPLNGIPVIEYELQRAERVSSAGEVVVATTENSQDDILENYVSHLGYSVFRGAESDVLGRLTNAAKEYSADLILRLSADNPLIPIDLMEEVVTSAMTNGWDYCSNKIERTFPIGFTAEAIASNTLIKLNSDVDDPFFREHVSKCFEKPESHLECKNITLSDIWSKDFYRDYPLNELKALRLTLDAAPDCTVLRRLHKEAKSGRVISSKRAIIYALENNLNNINSSVDQIVL